MLKIYNPNNTKLPHHNKILNKVSILFNALHKDFKDCNPIISGSYAINLIFKPSAPYKDVDFYFESEEDFQRASSLLKETCSFITATNNCEIYEKDDFQYQLIKREFLPPEKLIFEHDFYNCALAIQKENIYIADICFSLYRDSLIHVNHVRVFEEEDLSTQINLFAIFFTRLRKYIDRYDFTLSEETKKKLINLSEWVKKTLVEEDAANTQVTTNFYYDYTFTETESTKTSFLYIATLYFDFVKENAEDLYPLITTKEENYDDSNLF